MRVSRWRTAPRGGSRRATGGAVRSERRWARNGKKPGPAVHDDHCTVTDENGRVRHEFTTDGPNQLCLTDITEHKTAWKESSTSARSRTGGFKGPALR